MIKYLKSKSYVIFTKKEYESKNREYSAYIKKLEQDIEDNEDLSTTFFYILDIFDQLLEKVKILRNNTWDKKLVKEIEEKIRYGSNILTFGTKGLEKNDINNQPKSK